MLIKYRSDYRKIAMGLLSMIPDLKDVRHLTAELDWYEIVDNRVLYLWKDDNDDFAGVMGVDEQSDYVMLRLVTMSPEARTRPTTFQMFDELAEAYPSKRLMGTLATSPLIMSWEQNRHGREQRATLN